MGFHLIEDNELQEIVEAIKEKNGNTTKTFKGSEMAKEIKKQPMIQNFACGGSVCDIHEITEEDLSNIGGIQSYAFYGCQWLEKISIPEIVTSLGNNVFNQCLQLREVKLPSTIKGTGTAGFNSCNKLEKINVENLTSVGTSGFRYCDSLTELVFEDLLTIGATAFDSCDNLKTVVIKRGKVCTLANVNAFGGTPIASGNGYIYVTDSLVDEYKAAENWATYASQIKPVSEWEATQ